MLLPGRKALLFPVETTVRELDFRIVMACYCARPDNQIFIGNHTDIYHLGTRLRNALYLGKNLLNVSAARKTVCYREFKEARGRMIHLDEEGAVFNGGEDIWRQVLDMRLDPRWLEAEDHLCTWGQFQKDHYASFSPAVAPHIHATGHPRLNLAHPFFSGLYEEETRSLQEAVGPMILINTNFSFGNHALYPAAMLREKQVAPDNRDLRNYYLDYYAYCAGKLPVFLQLASRLSDSFPGHTIVFRPHPSENLTPYLAMAEHIPRMRVETRGSLVAWLRASDCLVHSGCTTALEALAGGVPVVNFQPLPGNRFVQQIPDLVGMRASSLDEAVEAVGSAVGGKHTHQVAAGDMHRIRHLLCNMGESSEAFLRVRDLTWRVQDELPVTQAGSSLASFPRRGRVEAAKAVLRPFWPASARRMSAAKAYRRRRFADLTPALLEPKLAAANALLRTGLRADYLSSRLVSLAVPV